MPAPIAAAIVSSIRFTRPRSGRQRRLHDRALLDVGDPRRRAHHHARMREPALVHPADEVPQHLLGDLEVRDHAMAQGPDRRDRRRRAADHPLGVVADRVHLTVDESTATTDGSDTTIPWPRTNTRVFAVPRSIAMSRLPARPIDERTPIRVAAAYRSAPIGHPGRLSSSPARLQHWGSDALQAVVARAVPIPTAPVSTDSGWVPLSRR